MDKQQALDKLISVRHHCFVTWRNADRDEDAGYRMAFRTLNRLYVALKGHSDAARGIQTNAGTQKG